MNVLESLQSLLGGASAKTPASAGAGAGAGGLGSMLNSGALGGIAASVLGDRKGGISLLKTALMAGAGSMLWKKLTERMEEQATTGNSRFTPAATRPAFQSTVEQDNKAARMIRALVFAAKSDGNIDARQKAAINAQVRDMGVGRAGEDMVQRAMNEALDPRLVASGVTDPQEALQLYALSAAIIDSDKFMEKNYLDALAHELNIPMDVKEQVDQEMRSSRLKV